MFRVIMTSCSLPFGPCALARKGGPEGLAPRAEGLGEPSAPPGEQGGLGGGTPPNIWSGKKVSVVPQYDRINTTETK